MQLTSLIKILAVSASLAAATFASAEAAYPARAVKIIHTHKVPLVFAV